MNYQLGTLPSACSCRAWFIEIFFPPSTVSSQRFYYIPAKTVMKQVCRFPPVFCGKSFPFSSPGGNPWWVSSLWPPASAVAGGSDVVLASAAGDTDPEAEGKGEEILLEMEKESLSCRLLSLRDSTCCKLH